MTRRHLLSNRLQHVYPKRLLSALMFAATRVRFGPWKNWQIRWFIDRYGVDMGETLEPDPLAYPEFNTFFTRPLGPDARPLSGDASALVAPADGYVLQFGDIRAGTLLQVKGSTLDATELLGGDAAVSAPFADGRFVTVYLSPRDYHRVHMPVEGRLRAMGYVPGKLFSVSLPSVHGIPRLFTRNERVVALFDTAAGPLALVLVGAVFVACIETVWAGIVRGPRDRVTWWDYAGRAPPMTLARGAEMGRFNMGSTVIALFGGDAVALENTLRAGQPIRMGETVGRHAATPA